MTLAPEAPTSSSALAPLAPGPSVALQRSSLGPSAALDAPILAPHAAIAEHPAQPATATPVGEPPVAAAAHGVQPAVAAEQRVQPAAASAHSAQPAAVPPSAPTAAAHSAQPSTAAAHSAEQAAAAEHSGRRKPSSKPRVLVAEDDPDVQGLVRHILEADGCDVTVVGDGELAVEQCRFYPPDLLVLDLMMPKLSGFEVLAMLQSQDPPCDVPVLILSARSSEADIVSGFKLGVSDYVTKPFMIAELRARVHSLLERRRRE